MAKSGRRSKRLRWVLVVGALLVVVALVAAWFATRKPSTTPPAYEAVTVSTSTQAETVTLSGTIAPQNQANATFSVPGTVAKVLVKVGDQVKKGAELATLGTQDLADAVALADAQVSAAKAQLTTVEDNPDVTQAQLDAAKAQLTSAQASANNAKNRLANATLTAPLDGTVAKVGYEVGDQVSGSAGASSGLSAGSLAGLGGAASGASGTTTQAIVVIATDAWQLNASVGTADLPKLKKGQVARITPTGTTAAVAGAVDTVGVVADQNAGATATFPVTIKVTDTGTALFAGSSADAVVTTGSQADVLTVPIAAVTTYNGVSTVQLLADGKASPRTVTLGKHYGAVVEVLSGLKVGDQIQVEQGKVVQTSAPLRPAASASATPSR